MAKEEDLVQIKAGAVTLLGNLQIPKAAKGIVLFAHGSGSGRHSPRNQFVAKFLNQGGLATLLIDLLTLEEEKVDDVTRQMRFDIEMLAGRLTHICDFLEKSLATKNLKIGLFGASTGAAAALISAAKKPELVQAVVSRGGRADLAGESLKDVKAPTLLIVGGHDYGVIELNEEALKKLHCVKKMAIVAKATHLFEEVGALEEVARLARDWFQRHLV